MGITGSESVDEPAILGDIGERLSFVLDFVAEFDMRTSTGSGEGVDGPSVTPTVSEEVTDGDELLDMGCGVAVRIDSCTTTRDDVGVISIRGTLETGDKILIPVFSFYNLRFKITEEPRSKSNTHRVRDDILVPFQLSPFGCLYQRPKQIE
jgi:hypothetical protein